MEPEGSLPHSQVPTTCPYPMPARPSPHPPHSTSCRSILILSSHLRLGLPRCLLPESFPTKTLYTPLFSPLRATYPAHLILLDIIKRKILGESNKMHFFIRVYSKMFAVYMFRTDTPFIIRSLRVTANHGQHDMYKQLYVQLRNGVAVRNL